MQFINEQKKYIYVFSNNICYYVDYRVLIFNLPCETDLSLGSLIKATLLPRHRLQNQSQSEMHPFDATRMLSEVAGRVIEIPKQTRGRKRVREKASIRSCYIPCHSSRSFVFAASYHVCTRCTHQHINLNNCDKYDRTKEVHYRRVRPSIFEILHLHLLPR